MANPESPKKIILRALTALVESTPFEGTEDGVDFIDLTGRVFRGRMLFGTNDPETMVSIVEAPQGSYDQYTSDNQAVKGVWLLLLQGWCPDDKENPSDPVYDLMYAVQRCIARITLETDQGYATYPDDYLLGRLIVDFQSGPGIVRSPTVAESSKAFFYLPLQVTLASDVG